MKKQLLIIITGLLIITSPTFAQKKDHSLIGHLEGANLWLQKDCLISDIEITENSSKISNGTNNEIPNNTEANKKSNSFTFQAGISQYNFYDPSLYGQNTVYQSNGVYSGGMSGFKNLAGLYVKAAYLFNENIGVVADFAFHYGEDGSYIENSTSSTTYKTSADLNFQRIGVMGRFIGEKYPIKLSLSSGFGRGSLETYYMIKTSNSTGETRVDYDGKGDFPMVFFQTELLIPLFKGLFFFSEYEYTVGWSDDFYMDHNTGSEYHSIKYKSPGFGGHNFRLGLGYEFGRK